MRNCNNFSIRPFSCLNDYKAPLKEERSRRGSAVEAGDNERGDGKEVEGLRQLVKDV